MWEWSTCLDPNVRQQGFTKGDTQRETRKGLSVLEFVNTKCALLDLEHFPVENYTAQILLPHYD